MLRAGWREPSRLISLGEAEIETLDRTRERVEENDIVVGSKLIQVFLSNRD